MQHLSFVYKEKVVEANAETVRMWMSDRPETLSIINLDDPEQYEAIVDLVFHKNGNDFWTTSELDAMSMMPDSVYRQHITVR